MWTEHVTLQIACKHSATIGCRFGLKPDNLTMMRATHMYDSSTQINNYEKSELCYYLIQLQSVNTKRQIQYTR